MLTPEQIKQAITASEARTISYEQLRIKLIDFTREQHGDDAAATAIELPTWQLVEMFRREHK